MCVFLQSFSPRNPHTLPIRADCSFFLLPSFTLFSNLCVLLHELICNPSDSVSDDSERWNPANEYERTLLLVHTHREREKKEGKSDSHFFLFCVCLFCLLVPSTNLIPLQTLPFRDQSTAFTVNGGKKNQPSNTGFGLFINVC